jgi:hypothetical protein
VNQPKPEISAVKLLELELKTGVCSDQILTLRDFKDK